MPGRVAPAVQRVADSVAELRAEIAAARGERVVVKDAWRVPEGFLPFEEEFPQARAFILDDTPYGFLAALCTRRAAKTYSVGLKFIWDAQDHPRAKYVFLSLTRESALNQFWDDVLKDIDRRFNLGIRFNETRLMAVLPNGARIQLVGADSDEKQQRKLLGGKNRMICVDEAQDWKIDLEKFVMGTLSPSVTDLKGQMIMVGTPGNLVTGYFHRVTNGCKAGFVSAPGMREPGWKVFSWTTFDNPFMREQHKAKIDSMVAANPRIVETPWFKQNYLGEWVVDLEARVYKFDLTRNMFNGELPRYDGGDWHFGLGIDLGYFPDPSAMVLTAYHDWDKRLYLLHSWKQWKMDFTDVAGRIKWYDEYVKTKYGARMEFYIVDGANKQGVEEMRRRHQLDLLPADKRGKEDFIDLMNSEFILGNILVSTDCSHGVRNSGSDESLLLSDEYEGLIWDQTALLEKKKRIEHPNCPNHLADSALYAWRRCYQYLSQMPPPPIKPGTPEWRKREVERMRERAEEEMRGRVEAGLDGDRGLGESDNWDPYIQR